MQNPLLVHWKVVKHILLYLASTIYHGLILSSSLSRQVSAYCDANSALDCNDRRSITGFCVYFGSNLIARSSKKQVTNARSSTAVEYCSMASVVAEVLWIKSSLQKFHVVSIGPARVFYDNLSKVMLIAIPILHARTKRNF